MSKFTCKKSELSSAIGNVSRAVAFKSTITALEGIKIEVTENKVCLTGYDLELGITTQIDATNCEKGEFIVNSKLFAEMIRKMPDEDVTVEVDSSLATKITSNKASCSIISLPADEYPDIPEFDKEKTLSIPQSLLKNMIGQTIFAVAVTDNKPILTGELFEIENGIFNLVAIDGYRLAVRSEQTNNDDYFRFVVPAKALKEVSNLMNDEEESVCNIITSRKHIIFDINGYSVFSRLLEGQFHNYKGSIPETSTTEVIVNTREVINALERCMLIISDKAKAPVRCNFDNGTMKISCSTIIGKVNDEIEVDFSGNSIEIGFNGRYFLDALKASESDKVKFSMTGGLSAMKISPLEGDKFTFLVLPVRLKD